MDGISLKEFIRETLVSISEGVSEAQEASKAAGGIPIALFSIGGKEISNGEQLVSFSIGVSVTKEDIAESSGDLGGGVLKIISASVNSRDELRSDNHNSQRIEFSVPIHFNSTWGPE